MAIARCHLLSSYPLSFQNRLANFHADTIAEGYEKFKKIIDGYRESIDEKAIRMRQMKRKTQGE